MIDFFVTKQTIRFATPTIAANSLDYLEAEFHFSGSDWDGYSKWAHFRQDNTVYDLNLVNDRIEPEMHLNLSLGQWEVFLTGTLDSSRLTTVPVIMTVMESGLIDEPLHQIPQSVAEQIDSKSQLALQKITALEEAAANGDFDGSNFQILGYFQSLEELNLAVTDPERGDAYGVGTESPYDIYVYDAISQAWVNNGSIQGPTGDTGAAGATFTPQVSDNGNLSWSNNGGLTNPSPVNIMGPQGTQGIAGADGLSPYELAAQEGFTGTEATFNWSLAHIASHAAQHAATGTDPITPAMIGAATIGSYSATFLADAWSESEPYTQSVTVTGLSAGAGGTADIDLSNTANDTVPDVLEAWSFIGRMYAETANTLTAICYTDLPQTDMTVQLKVFGNTVGSITEVYSGSYTVTPSTQSQILETENQTMASDLNVEAIPSYSVSNDADGETIIIGGNEE